MDVSRSRFGVRMGQLALVLAVAATAACGGGQYSAGTNGTDGTAETSPAESNPAESSAAPDDSGDVAAGGDLGTELCTVIKRVQKDLISGSPDAAYTAQFVIGISGVLIDDGKLEEFRASGDAEAQATCPAEYATFLNQAKITSLSSL